MPTDPIRLPLTSDDLGTAVIDSMYPGLRRRHWWHVEAISADKTVDEDTEFLMVTATASGGVTITLADSTVNAGQSIIIGSATVASGQTISILPISGDTVNSTSSLTITASSKFVHLISDGAGDWILYLDGR